MNLLTMFSNPIGAGLEVIHEADWFFTRLQTRTDELKTPSDVPMFDRFTGAFIETYTDYYASVATLWALTPDTPNVLLDGVEDATANAANIVSLRRPAPATTTLYRQAGAETVTAAFTQSTSDPRIWTVSVPMAGVVPGLYSGVAVSGGVVVCQVFLTVAPAS